MAGKKRDSYIGHTVPVYNISTARNTLKYSFFVSFFATGLLTFGSPTHG